jgi:DNA-directed RNA polymerase subunit RPC12/RpoP
VKCEWPECVETGTHTVEIAFTEGDRETWWICRAHDRVVKLQAVRSRPPRPSEAKSEPTLTVLCGHCKRALDEQTDVKVEDRQTCPDCGSLRRHVELHVTDSATIYEWVRVRKKAAGKGGWMVETRTGDDYTHNLDAWGRRSLTIDRENDRYREVIQLYDGTVITSTARLRDHRDDG